MASAQRFDEALADTQSGADEVRDFARRTSYAFPSADVLVPAPMAVSILGQLTLIATATDFKLVRPPAGFKHVSYPDSFRATIIQLVNSGCLALNKSFVNFDEINKRCAAVRPGVNNIVELLVGKEDNTPRQNELAIERHLPNQILSLSKTVQACLEKAKETDHVFSELLELTMEIHESCTATQGANEDRIREANIRKAFMAQERTAMETMKQISADATKQAREDFTNAQSLCNDAMKSMPSAWTIAGLQLLDVATGFANVLTLGFLKSGRNTSSSASGSSGAAVRNDPAIKTSAVNDPGYQKASALRTYADMLDTLLIAGENGSPDWMAIKSHETSGCIAVRIAFEQIQKSIKLDHKHAGGATRRALAFAKKGIEFSRKLESMAPPGVQTELSELVNQVTAWREDVVAFASEADLSLGTTQMGPRDFLPQPSYSSGGSSAELAVRNAQYKLNVAQAQLRASRENSAVATEKLLEVTGQLGDIMAQIAGLDVQKQNWEEIRSILLKAIEFLCELKKYLNNLVYFFEGVDNLVSITLKETADQFIRIVKDATAIEYGERRGVAGASGVSLDAWTRQAIYNHALSTAKITRVVENISDMYVTLYDGSIHPGVNMLLGMGKLVGTNDPERIAAAGREIQGWADEANNKIVQLISERMHANEVDIQNRLRELERSLGGILPRSERLEEIVNRAEAAQVQETAKEMDTAAEQNPVYKRKAKMFV